MKINRKLKKAIEMSEFWLNAEIEGFFSSYKDDAYEYFRESEEYDVFMSQPDGENFVPVLQVVPKIKPVGDFSQEEQDEIIQAEAKLFKVMMTMSIAEDDTVKLNKKSRDEYRDYLLQRIRSPHFT